MSAWPFSLIGGSQNVHSEVAGVEQQIYNIQSRLETLRSQDESQLNEYEHMEIERLEREERLLQRQRHELEQTAKSFTNRCILVFRPFQFIFGIFFALLGLVIFVSILLTQIDRAMHSDGAKTGYLLKNASLPNPVDLLLVYAQEAFPLDYIMYGGIVLFFIFSSIYAVKVIGIRFMWLSLYKIKAHSTKPQVRKILTSVFAYLIISFLGSGSNEFNSNFDITCSESCHSNNCSRLHYLWFPKIRYEHYCNQFY